jgi:hypothetical protein
MNTIFDTLPVAITYVGETSKYDSSPKSQIVDQWRIALTSKAGYWSTDYFTGTGLRKKGKPVKPTIQSVMESLVLDASAADYNFSDWCDEFGYSDDSISALNTYKQCLAIATMLRKHCGRDTMQQVKEALREEAAS